VIDLKRLPNLKVQNLPITVLDFNKEITNEQNLDNGAVRGAVDLFQLFNLPSSGDDQDQLKKKRKQSRKM
jgi:hypothetical protein